MDLKWHLVRRITLVALSCFLAGAALALYVSARDAQRQNQALAELARRHLELQLSRIDRSTELAARFPDWDLIASYALAPGQCVEFKASDGSKNRSSCAGVQTNASPAPMWFAEAFRRFINDHVSATEPLTYRGRDHGAIRTAFDPAAISGQAWAAISPLLGLSALLVSTLCLVTYFVVDRALRPTREILSGLNRLASGDLKVSLPPFELSELNRISQVFNSVAAELEKTTTERAELAHRLIDTQERERQHLARELHDEIAQKLAAMNAQAACIRSSAQTEAPDLVGEARDLEKMASDLMVSLRRTLSYLRPQEIDDLGLVASLRALVEQHNEAARGRTVYSIEVADEVAKLRSETSAHVYRIVQEALTNVSKHANASSVSVRLTEHPESDLRHMRLSVIDDGVGDDAAKTNARQAPGSGVIGMRERVVALRGTFAAGPLPSGGYGLEIEFPTSPQEA